MRYRNAISQMLVAVLGFLSTSLALWGGAWAQSYSAKTRRQAAHNIGQIQLNVRNSGVWGDTMVAVDVFSGDRLRSLIFPRGSDIQYGAGWLIAGAIRGRDTLVTDGAFLPDEPPHNEFRLSSIEQTGTIFSAAASSNLDITCSFNDTISSVRDLGWYGHVPINLHVTQRIMGWAADNINCFLLFDCELTALRGATVKDGYVGIVIDPGVRHSSANSDLDMNLIGALPEDSDRDLCLDHERHYIAYWMDNDGDPTDRLWTARSPVSAMGLTILRSPSGSTRRSFNWAVFYDNLLGYWMPLKRADVNKCERNSWGFPLSSSAYYFLLSNGYSSIDQLFMSVDYRDSGLIPPAPRAPMGAAGSKWGFGILSVGPFDLSSGQSVHFTYALVGGENVHVNPTDFATLWDPFNPQVYYNSLDFTDLMTNARWAKWVYDNPGVDSDGDGYFGKFRLCDGDTNWYEGDGVPDFRADIPPPSPKLRIIPSVGKLTLRWNGYYSENAIDPFTKVKDFEGYRVYMGLDDREGSFATLTSWDYPNYNRYHLREKPNHTFVWETKDLPYTIDSLRAIYGSDFNPLLYTKDNPLHVGDSQYYFAPVDYNLSSFLPNGVHKVYPDAVNPGTDTTQWTDELVTTEHGSPLPKYYEYEYTIENVLPTVANYVSVTSFDFGFAKGNIPAKESPKRENQTVAYAQTSAEAVAAENLNVYVYPNPYVWQKDYHSLGYENRDNRQIPARSHRINFGNLPPRCTISIFSLDGDLVRSWEHNYDANDPQGMHDAWDLITRNTMLAVAGLYYWVVESPGRTQIGKFVIIM